MPGTESEWYHLLSAAGKELRKWYISIPVLIVVAGVLIPLIYLVLRAGQANPEQLFDLVFRWRNAVLLFNTLALAIGVLICTSLIALPLAWLTTRVDMPGRGVLTVLGVLPLAVPGYVMAYALLSTTGEYGALAQAFGLVLSRLDGYDGALIALSLTTYPYLFLNLRTAFLGMDPGLEESARVLGAGRVSVFFRVIFPQLRPAFLAGGLLVGLHVLGDFGVVSLMRFDTFSYALYLQYTASYDRIYAACLALILLLTTIVALVLEGYYLKGYVFDRGGEGNKEGVRVTDIGKGKYAGYVFCGCVVFLSVGLPLLTLLYWLFDGASRVSVFSITAESLKNSVVVSLPAAVLAGVLALPIAYLSVRHDSWWTRGLERLSYLGYATPPLALALAWIVFVLWSVPFLYQTLFVLIFAYALHFLAESIGPIRSALYQTPEGIEEAAKSLGSGPAGTFVHVLFPLVRRGFLVGVAFVFLSAMKELPLTILLAPPGFHTLATNTWSYAEEAMFAKASPFALTIIVFSACFVWLLLRQKR